MRESTSCPAFSGSRRRRTAAALGLALLLPMAAVSLAAQESTLQRQLKEEFELLPLRDGLALRPLDPELGISTIQLDDDELLVDGVSISLEELEARLGDSAAPFRQLLALAPGDRRAWIESGGPGAAAPEPPAAPVAPEAELPERVAEEERRADARRRAEVRRRIDRARGRSDAKVVIASPLTVAEDEVSRDVVVLGGTLTVRGRVIGGAAAIGGSAVISGEIDGDLSVVGGSITLEEGAEVRGDVISVGGAVNRAEDTVVAGQVLEVPFGPAVRIGDWDWRGGDDDSDHGEWRWFSFSPLGYMLNVVGEVVCLIVLSLLACLVLLLAPGPVEQVRRRAVEEPWQSGLAGLLSQILIGPVLLLVCVVLVISVIGIPLLVLVPFALLGLLLVAFLGYTAVALAVGRWLETRFGWRLESPYVALLVGIVAIQLLSFLGEVLDVGLLWFFSLVFGLLGFLVCYVAWTVGFGAAILTRFGTAPGWSNGGGWAPAGGGPSYAEPAPGPPEVLPEPPPAPGEWEEPPRPAEPE